MSLTLVPDMRELREPPSSVDEVAAFETDVLAGFVLARASAGLADSTIHNDTGYLDLIRGWFGRPLWEMQPEDADAYFGQVLRVAKPSTRTGRTDRHGDDDGGAPAGWGPAALAGTGMSEVRKSGLWNVQTTNSPCVPRFLTRAYPGIPPTSNRRWR